MKEVVNKNMSNPKEAKYFNAFNLIGQIGPVSFKNLLSHFKSLEEAWSANISEFRKTGLTSSTINQIKEKRLKISPDDEMEKLSKENIELITINDKDYPELLKEIYTPPALLYLRGQIKAKDKNGIGIVGSRKLSSYAQKTTPLITTSLIKSGLTIISGLAKGVDTLAHETALKLKGRTIAVLGSGLDKKSIYPSQNRYLADRITESGALISEYPIGTKPFAQNFPQRNRIISGLSLGVLVIEAQEKSGSLITAKNALEQNREVFAIPGSIFNQNSIGTNNLIKMGAKLVNQTSDILEELKNIK